MMDRGRYANVVSMGIIPKMYFVTEEISIPYELHWFVDSNVALIFQRHPHQTINNEKPRKDILQFIFPADEGEVEFKTTGMLK